jgi:RAT1-interacting protein
MCYWGYKFEALSTIGVPANEINSPDDPELLARKTTVVNTKIQYCSVAKTTFGKNRLIMGAEVDCLADTKPPYPENPIDRYIELKTSKIPRRAKDTFIFERYVLRNLFKNKNIKLIFIYYDLDIN